MDRTPAAAASCWPRPITRARKIGCLDRIISLGPGNHGDDLRRIDGIVERRLEQLPCSGIHDELVAHLTLLAHPERPSLDGADRVAADAGPVERQVRSVELITQAAAGRWRVRWRWAMSS